MRQRDRQSGLSALVVSFIVLAVTALAVTGLVAYRHHKPSNAKNSAATSQAQTTTQPKSTATTQPASAATHYLDVKEWGVKLPLPDNIRNTYYVVPEGISNDADGKPSAIEFGLTSLNATCGTVTGKSTNYNSIGAIVRALPTDTDPLSGKLYTQLDPIGATINGYYYGYANAALKSKTCSSQALLQSVDSAFATAVKGMVSDTAN